MRNNWLTNPNLEYSERAFAIKKAKTSKRQSKSRKRYIKKSVLSIWRTTPLERNFNIISDNLGLPFVFSSNSTDPIHPFWKTQYTGRERLSYRLLTMKYKLSVPSIQRIIKNYKPLFNAFMMASTGWRQADYDKREVRKRYNKEVPKLVKRKVLDKVMEHYYNYQQAIKNSAQNNE